MELSAFASSSLSACRIRSHLLYLKNCVAKKMDKSSREHQPQIMGLQIELVLFTKVWLSSQPRQRSRSLFFKKSLGCLMKLAIVNIVGTNASVEIVLRNRFQWSQNQSSAWNARVLTVLFFCLFNLFFLSNPSLKGHWSFNLLEPFQDYMSTSITRFHFYGCKMMQVWLHLPLSPTFLNGFLISSCECKGLSDL